MFCYGCYSEQLLISEIWRASQSLSIIHRLCVCQASMQLSFASLVVLCTTRSWTSSVDYRALQASLRSVITNAYVS